MNVLNRAVAAWKHRGLATHLALMFGATGLAILLAIIVYVNHSAVDIVRTASQSLFDRTAGETRSTIDENFGAVNTALQLFAVDPQTEDFNGASRPSFIRRLGVMLNASPVLSAIYIGYDDGSFVLLRQLTSSVARSRLHAPATAEYFYETVSGGNKSEMTSHFLDVKFNQIATPDSDDQAFDPRTRGWYRAASAGHGAILTDPYWFFMTQELGVTMARRLQYGQGVVGADLGLADVSAALTRMKSTPSSRLLIVNDNGQVIASDSPAGNTNTDPSQSATATHNGPTETDLISAAAKTSWDASQTHTERWAGRAWIMRIVPLSTGSWTFHLVMATPKNEMLASAHTLVSNLGWLSILMALIALVVVWMVARAVSRPLQQLADDAEALQRFQFRTDEPAALGSSVREIHTLSRAIHKASQVIPRFIEIGRALAAEHDPDDLMQRLLHETLHILEAEGGVLLMAEDDGESLSAIARSTPARGNTAQTDLPRSISKDMLGDTLQHALARHTATHVDMAGRLPAFLAELTGATPLLKTQVFRFSVIPLCERSGRVVGDLLLVNRVEADAPASDTNLPLAVALSGNAAVAMETTLLLKSRKALLDAVIRMIAQAIDAKSPYTGRHCVRVPMLTLELARAASEASHEPFSDFALSPDEWEAVEVAGWLHDCGKLTTAEYIIDKATKLETIYDRIHEIRMRFELLKSMAWVAYWQAVAEGGDRAALASKRDTELASLDADFAFIATCNEGGEAMAPADIERLRQIAQRTWVRTLDDRIGISHDEKLRKNRSPAPTLPVREPLLADRDDHLIVHHDNEISAREEEAGFRMTPETHRLNLGELYNLSINRGTLTAEERFEINRHITRTIVMLEALPLTGALKRVPEYAGNHHEKMDGSGYPRGRHREEMSVVARIMAIADVFEALTASDRPYKKAKKLSEVLRIMGFMKRDHHLDPDLLDLFFTSGVWRRYAEEFMEPEQIDDCNIDALLAIQPAPMPKTA